MQLIGVSGSMLHEEQLNRYYEHNGEYFIDIDDQVFPTTKLDIAETVSLYWNLDCNNFDTEKIKNGYRASIFIPIYDDIYITLYGFDKTEEIARKNVQNMFDDFIALYKQYEQNSKRNQISQYKNMKRFAYIPKNREADFSDSIIGNGEWVFFNDNTKSFRELAINTGIPNDARADLPIFGYVENNMLVFFKEHFIKDEKEKYLSFIKDNYVNIAKHYGLEEYEVYTNMVTLEELYRRTEKDLSDSLVTGDYLFFFPENKLER